MISAKIEDTNRMPPVGALLRQLHAALSQVLTYKHPFYKEKSIIMLKRIGMALGAVVVFIGLFAVAGNAQPGKARWHGNNGKHTGWNNGNHRGWDRGHKNGWRWNKRDRHDRHDRHERGDRDGRHDGRRRHRG